MPWSSYSMNKSLVPGLFLHQDQHRLVSASRLLAISLLWVRNTNQGHTLYSLLFSTIYLNARWICALVHFNALSFFVSSSLHAYTVFTALILLQNIPGCCCLCCFSLTRRSVYMCGCTISIYCHKEAVCHSHSPPRYLSAWQPLSNKTILSELMIRGEKKISLHVFGPWKRFHALHAHVFVHLSVCIFQI